MIKPLRIVFLVFGILLFALGVAAAFLPVLPSFPFLLFSVILISKGSPRIGRWMVSTKIYQNNVVAIRDRKAMTLPAKVKLIATLTLVFGLSFAMVPIWHVRVLLFLLWALHVAYFAIRLKTIRTTSSPEANDAGKESDGV